MNVSLPFSQGAQASAELASALLKPRSIALVGASDDPAKLNGRMQRFLAQHGYEGRIYPVNPKYEKIAGLTAYPSLGNLPEPVDIASIMVPAKATLPVLREAIEAGVKVAMLHGSGFAEMGGEGEALQREVEALAQSSKTRVLGPNCVGFVNYYDKIFASFSQIGANPCPPGPIAFATQSGAVGTMVNTMAKRRGLGIGYLYATGNECDLSFVDILRMAIEDTRIQVLAAYCESIADADGLRRLAERSLELGKPVVLLKPGRSEAGARAIASHTGALAREDRVCDQILREWGILRAKDELQMMDMVDALVSGQRPKGTGIGFLSQSGGACSVMADLAADLRLKVPELSVSTKKQLARHLPPYASLANPVDATMLAVSQPEILVEGFLALLQDEGVHVGLIWIQHMEFAVDRLEQVFARIQEKAVKPWGVVWVACPDEALGKLKRRGVWVATSGRSAIEGVRAMRSFAEKMEVAGSEDPALSDWDGTTLHELLEADKHSVLGTEAATALLRSVGIATPAVRIARTEDECVAAWRAIGSPVALKVEAPALLHKTEAGGVALGLHSEEDLRAASRAIRRQVAERAPEIEIEGLAVCEMASGSVEMMVTFRQDAIFGPIVVVGLGGTYVELLDDVSIRSAPVTKRTAERMLSELRGARLLDGLRGKPAIDRSDLADLIVKVGQLGAALAEELEEIELNPVICSERAAVAVDWVMARRKKKEDFAL